MTHDKLSTERLAEIIAGCEGSNPRIGTNSGHGHVWKRPDGRRMRCGGPGMCSECSADALLLPKPADTATVKAMATELQALRSAVVEPQATKCAGCGEHKSTPLRRDDMGGYVCLTCIDAELTALRRSAVVDDAAVERDKLLQHVHMMLGYHIVSPPTPDSQFVNVCNGYLRILGELFSAYALIPALVPVASHETNSRDTQAILPCTDETQAALVPGHVAEAGKVEAKLTGIYVASKVKHAEMWRDLRTFEGMPIISTWIDEAGPGESADLNDLWSRCIREASTAAALIIYRRPDEVLKGAWVELGAALASGVPVFAVGIEEFTVAKDERIRHFPTLVEARRAVAALVQS